MPTIAFFHGIAIRMYKGELRMAWEAVRNDQTPERIPGPDADNDN